MHVFLDFLFEHFFYTVSVPVMYMYHHQISENFEKKWLPLFIFWSNSFTVLWVFEIHLGIN